MSIRRTLALLLAAAMLLGLCAGCGKKPEELYDEAMEAIDGGDAAKGEKLLTKAAEKDYAPASAMLGSMYYFGDEIEQDYAKAKELFEQGAAQDDPYCEVYLADMYMYGDGVEIDYPRAPVYLHRPMP